mgnify:CR=1 FL=1
MPVVHFLDCSQHSKEIVEIPSLHFVKMDTSTLSPELLAIHNEIVAKGDEIRALKGSGAAKDALMPHITTLNELKEK